MITKETKSVKTWGGFNLAILKVNLNPTRLTSYCYPPIELTDTTICKLRTHGLFLS